MRNGWAGRGRGLGEGRRAAGASRAGAGRGRRWGDGWRWRQGAEGQKQGGAGAALAGCGAGLGGAVGQRRANTECGVAGSSITFPIRFTDPMHGRWLFLCHATLHLTEGNPSLR